ncbi:histone H4 [Scheffersomyces stipitis CBS 6054]|uniref:Histone H4 n=1 Tax=Scheffersomyces stipitis (strain ATCC 58785 / CBS 6054 / NBRC 10063 / NRRL Y-11545) TaxID=322104 RepID=A3LNH3_PICST|nr:histone H4 [Scheffersomyces stipitis CBS 6054]ABN64856.2 histone H4 [Scheffersomyces stipitis CBS 6054]
MAKEDNFIDPNSEVGKQLQKLKDEFKQELLVQSAKYDALMEAMKAQSSSGVPPPQINKSEDRNEEIRKDAKKDSELAATAFKGIVPLARNIDAITKWEKAFLKLFRRYGGLQKIWDEDLGHDSKDFNIKNIPWHGKELETFIHRLSDELISRIIDINEKAFSEIDEVNYETDLKTMYIFVKTYKMENLPHRIGQVLTYLRYTGDFRTDTDRAVDGLSHIKQWVEGTNEEILDFLCKMKLYYIIVFDRYLNEVETRNMFYKSLAWFFQEHKKDGKTPTIDDVIQRMRNHHDYEPPDSSDKRTIESLISERIKNAQEREKTKSNGNRGSFAKSHTTGESHDGNKSGFKGKTSGAKRHGQ